MNDPHVTKLLYRVAPVSGVSYNEPPPVAFAAPFFNASLSAGVLECDMKAHFASVAEAREAVDDFLLAWEINAGLERGRPALAFNFWRADVVDRNPTPNTIRSSMGALSASFAGLVGNRATSSAFSVSSRRPILEWPGALDIHANYDVGIDGRLLVVKTPGENAKMTVIVNWASDVRARLAAESIKH